MAGTWKVFGLKSHKDSGGVFKASLIYSIINEEYRIASQKSIEVEFTYNPNNEDFISFNDLTEENIVNWARQLVDFETIENEVLQDYNSELLKISENNVSEDLPESFNNLPPEFDVSGI